MELTTTQEAKLIRAILSIVKMDDNYDAQDLEVAKVILKNYYAVGCFFLKQENKPESGLNLSACATFLGHFREVINLIRGN